MFNFKMYNVVCQVCYYLLCTCSYVHILASLVPLTTLSLPQGQLTLVLNSFVSMITWCKITT